MEAPKNGRGLYLAAWALALGSGAVYYTLIFTRGIFQIPWYFVAASTLAVVLAIAGLFKKRGILRYAATLILALIAFTAWMPAVMKVPPYEGPVVVGKPLPVVLGKKADGTPFTNADLIGKRTAVVFYRGWW